MLSDKKFTFEISLSVLNHLGRNLYRSFITILGEAISNSWDADAKNVWIYIDRDKDSFIIKDDGNGMSAGDFQDKFLKIGYSKRKGGVSKSDGGRPFIGRKGIGKLALLSCAKTISVISKQTNEQYVGGVIENSGLDDAIKNDLTPDEYPLGAWDESLFAPYTEAHDHGTIIHFAGIKDGIRNRVDYIKRVIALYFRFSLYDEHFDIFVDGELITLDHLKELAEKTEFAWRINDLKDPFLDNKLIHLKEPIKDLKLDYDIKGFIASVEKPRNLKVLTTDEKVGVDLFVNGRLRERDILKHIPTARVVESYLYGQIHFDDLDDGVDRFSTAREGIVSEDPKFIKLLEKLKTELIGPILEDWDKWRRKHRLEGDSENESITKKQRKSEELFDAVTEEYDFPKGTECKARVDKWSEELREDAVFNFSSYADCFASENLLRKYIEENGIGLSKEAKKQVEKWKLTEKQRKGKGNISIDIRRGANDLHYLTMNDLAYLADKRDPIKEACLARDANEYEPIRDAVAHTALLTEEAKRKLTSVYENIKARVKQLLSGNGKPKPNRSKPKK